MDLPEPAIRAASREDLLYLLAEAAEIEHNLMCCYLYAAFGLKTEADGLDAAAAAEVAGWKRVILGVAVEEMTHLALVANLASAIGGAAHLGRPNFPVAPGYHPSGVVVELAPLDRATLDHFIFLERPEGVTLPDGAGFGATDPSYVRDTLPLDRLMPSAQDYLTVGHLYRSIRAAVESLAATLGEAALFRGDPALQVGPELVTLPGLIAVTDLASARQALETVVEQGEGAPADDARSHYRRFLGIRAAWEARLAREPGFAPSRAVARNPVMRRPPTPAGKTWVDHPAAVPIMDLANALYGAMLRCLAGGFAEAEPGRKRLLLDAAIEGMFALAPVAEHLTTLPARRDESCRAGMSFAMLRDVAAPPAGSAGPAVLAERLAELAARAPAVLPPEVAGRVVPALTGIADRLLGRGQPAAPEVEVAEGRDLTLLFEGRRCIHARFCVLGEPGVFKANVVGPWLAPDEATGTEALVAVAHACPSGAIRYRRKDGGPEERAPLVNLVRVRENGPLALHGELLVDGAAAGFRATLCRCGASANKPYCDGSHAKAGFAATGEPPTGDTTALEARNGPLDIRPQRDGPLAVSGAMEIVSGTGRSVTRSRAAMLCRCGASANKPFCDGSHARVGFRS